MPSACGVSPNPTSPGSILSNSTRVNWPHRCDGRQDSGLATEPMVFPSPPSVAFESPPSWWAFVFVALRARAVRASGRHRGRDTVMAMGRSIAPGDSASRRAAASSAGL